LRSSLAWRGFFAKKYDEERHRHRHIDRLRQARLHFVPHLLVIATILGSMVVIIAVIRRDIAMTIAPMRTGAMILSRPFCLPRTITYITARQAENLRSEKCDQAQHGKQFYEWR
jgi:hypothetical protein